MVESSNPEPTARQDGSRYALSNLFRTSMLPRLALIGVVLLALAGAFAATAGWLSPQRLTPEKIVARFEEYNGVHPGFRRNHAKGVCVSGVFESSGEGAAISRASLFRPDASVPVFGRFALAGGNPFMADSPAAVRSLALNFALPDRELWRTGMNDIPVFPVKDAQGFYDFLAATRPDPKTGKPDPAKMEAFLKAHPEAPAALKLITGRQMAEGFADATYNSLNAFEFVDAHGTETPVRWSVMPVDPPKPDAAPEEGENYLFDALAGELESAPLRWRLVATVGEPGDSTSDPTIPWPDGRRKVTLGTLTLDRVEDEEHGPCRDVTFDPLILPDGIASSDDQILSARSAAYAVSFREREGETKEPSAVEIANPGSDAK
ncbi:Catalase-related peroxidase precursor [Methyloligella halotolerans]|uniref:Catalase-related peroxidase n=1 Tax=Methyloligella halotolerans TaxID=1177755 RepID=A0A1E2S0N3_9HYPH|nr:catalase family peroxidase [Methyloligella halotolerans]ODA67960.1 Catalase-related peroxidase precursor [Methyloligella halotolerans]